MRVVLSGCCARIRCDVQTRRRNRKHEAMAIVLKPKTNYKLLSEHHSSHDKHIVHVKLTDSCLRALEDYQNSKGNCRQKPTIRFTGQNGTITLPVKKKTAGGGEREFRFACSSTLQSLGQGCLDCIHQPSNEKALQSLGSITHKINIMATDDSYTMTRDKMKEAEEERKEVRTKIIKTPSTGGKKRVTSNKLRSSNMLMAVKRKMQNIPKVSNGPSKSVRERVIHILALRPYKKPELIDRLRKDGVSLKDRNSLTNILQQVALINNNQYKLMKHIYSEIQVDSWPSYSDEERKILQRLLQSEEQNSSQTYAVKNNPVTPKEPPSNKRPPSSVAYPTPATKKQRIAHVNTNNNITKESPDDEKPSITIPQPNLSPDAQQPVNDKKKSFNSHRNKKSTSHSSSKGSSVEDTSTDYKSKYLPISSYEQRCSYRRDFQVEYEEYLQLQNKIDSVTKKFTELKGKLKKCPQGSKERESIEKQVRQLYQKHQQDPSWARCKKRCQALHTKLTYIKELIREYDVKRTELSSPPT